MAKSPPVPQYAHTLSAEVNAVPIVVTPLTFKCSVVVCFVTVTLVLAVRSPLKVLTPVTSIPDVLPATLVVPPLSLTVVASIPVKLAPEPENEVAVIIPVAITPATLAVTAEPTTIDVAVDTPSVDALDTLI